MRKPTPQTSQQQGHGGETLYSLSPVKSPEPSALGGVSPIWVRLPKPRRQCPFKLSPAEATRFTELHQVVRTGLKKMSRLRLQVAAALLEIRDKKLYRGAYKSFEHFCAIELNLLKAHA